MMHSGKAIDPNHSSNPRSSGSRHCVMAAINAITTTGDHGSVASRKFGMY